MQHAIIALKTQAVNCDNRFCDIHTNVVQWGMDIENLERQIDSLGLKQKDIAAALGITPDKVSKTLTGKRQWSATELVKLTSWIDELLQSGAPDLPLGDSRRSYLPVKILPSFAGAGGGGSGDGDHETGLVPRHVVEDELRARPDDMLLIDVRGDSMMPDFHHGDQILVDTRDKNLAQPGSFAIWDGDGYVIKLVERIADNREKLRVFSANDRYTPYDVLVEEIEIMGRPVWFARRL